VVALSRERFEELVADALDALPPDLGKAMANVAVTVEGHDPNWHLLGLYEGVPLTERGPLSYSAVMPDHITLYQDTISQLCSTEDEVKDQVRRTVIHEVAHHFGISDPRLKELGWG
jgi:predicted Zn-dependent protease with MMP-like domain